MSDNKKRKSVASVFLYYILRCVIFSSFVAAVAANAVVPAPVPSSRAFSFGIFLPVLALSVCWPEFARGFFSRQELNS